MKARCKICNEIKDNVEPKFIGNEFVDPIPPFIQKQLIAKTLVICKSCYEKFKKEKLK